MNCAVNCVVNSARPIGRSRANAGMTLLELMVALSIFGILASALYPVLTGTFSSRRDARARAELSAEARMILDRVEQDVLGNWDAGFSGPLPPRFVAAAAFGRSAAGERNIFETTTLVARGVTPTEAFVGGEDIAALSADRGDQAHVLWRMDSSGQLLRQEKRPPSIELVDWRNVPFEVMSERANFTLEFYEPDVWLESWDSTETGPHRGRAPMAVRTTVTVTEPEGASVQLVSSVVLPVIASAVDPRQPGGGGG